ncbi:MAG: thiamine pyrophosphate-dependent dehydrogenase E1 component subunit alpha [Alphaproteobacteria bacterium]|nr:thiamine pyrophosphate-dependent dehydrogenase E1 component subunit alpha [Alphaproteobacteria bacterium]
MTSELNQQEAMELLRTMLLIRRFEEGLIQTQKSGISIGHFHVYIGQECTGAAAIALLEPQDKIATTHRNHGHLLARGADPRRLYAEILGKAAGYNKGKGGTLHATVAGLGFLSTSALVGGAVPLAVGAGFAAKQLGERCVSVGFFGDGVLEEGVFFESLNMASLWKLPVVFMCENNSAGALGQSAGEYPGSTIATKQLIDVVAPFGVPASAVDGGDPRAVRDVTQQALARARNGGGPTFIEARTVRWPGSRPLWPELSTGETDVAFAWEPDRIPMAHRDWFANDGLIRYVRQLFDAKLANTKEILALDATVRADLAKAMRFAIEAPYPDPASALDDVFA